jgi:hypothetical protein
VNSRIERTAIEAVAIFIAISATAGGVGLILGGLAFPLEWLAGTPFGSYVMPGAILALIVGGSALAATVLMLQKNPFAVPVALLAGAIQVGWIIGELLLVGTRGDVMAWLQAIYFVAGLIVAVLAAHIWLRSAHGARQTT